MIKNFSLIAVIIATIFVAYTGFNQFKKGAGGVPREAGVKKEDVEVIAWNLEIPWEIAFLPSGEMLVTERSGNLVKIDNDRTVIKINGVSHIGEGGLLGIAVHPQFLDNHLIYLYLTTEENGKITNRVERYKLEGTKLLDRKVIVAGILGSSIHDGGRMAFGPAFVSQSGTSAGREDYYLYITTGDAGSPNLAQDKNSLNGKILRVTDDGLPPSDNPFGNAVYSYGHRNPQGLAWDENGKLWATEHGQSAQDELNLIEKGKNYGWPVIQGDERKEGMVSPIIQSGDDTWAPAGATFFDDSIFFGGLRGEALYEYQIGKKQLKTHFKGQFGRIRAVVLGPDDFLYMTTSNRDGRGSPKEEDDKIIKINPEIFRDE